MYTEPVFMYTELYSTQCRPVLYFQNYALWQLVGRLCGKDQDLSDKHTGKEATWGGCLPLTSQGCPVPNPRAVEIKKVAF